MDEIDLMMLVSCVVLHVTVTSVIDLFAYIFLDITMKASQAGDS